MTDTSNTVYTVHVQRADVTLAIDDYIIDGGCVPSVESTSDRELVIAKQDDDTSQEMFVASYAQGCWLRAWIEEE
jgi:hypothetical protein